MDLATSRHYLKPHHSVTRSRSSNRKENQTSVTAVDYSHISARESHQSHLSHRPERNSLKNVMEAGYVRPPPTIVKPFNLSRSQSRPNTHRDETPQRSVNITQRSAFPKPFVVYRSDKPLTIPQEFHLSGRKREPSAPIRKKDERPEDILKRLRAKAAKEIISQNKSDQRPSELIQKFKEFSGKEINRIYEEFGKRRDSLKERPRNLWKI